MNRICTNATIAGLGNIEVAAFRDILHAFFQKFTIKMYSITHRQARIDHQILAAIKFLDESIQPLIDWFKNNWMTVPKESFLAIGALCENFFIADYLDMVKEFRPDHDTQRSMSIEFKVRADALLNYQYLLLAPLYINLGSEYSMIPSDYDTSSSSDDEEDESD